MELHKTYSSQIIREKNKGEGLSPPDFQATLRKEGSPKMVLDQMRQPHAKGGTVSHTAHEAVQIMWITARTLSDTRDNL